MYKRIKIRAPTKERIINYIPPTFNDIIVFAELREKNLVEAYKYIIDKCIVGNFEKWEIFWVDVVDAIIMHSPFNTFDSLMAKYEEIATNAEQDEIIARKLFMYKLALTLGRSIEEVKNWSEEDFIYFSYLATQMEANMANEYTQQTEIAPQPQISPRPLTYNELLAEAIRSANIALANEINKLQRHGYKFAKTKEELNEMRKKYKKNVPLDDFSHIRTFLTKEDLDKYRANLLRERAKILLKNKEKQK